MRRICERFPRRATREKKRVRDYNLRSSLLTSAHRADEIYLTCRNFSQTQRLVTVRVSIKRKKKLGGGGGWGKKKRGRKTQKKIKGSCTLPFMKIALRFGQQIRKLLKASFESPPCNSLELAPTPSSIDTSRCLSTVIGVAM